MIYTIVQLGLIYGLLSVGVYITYSLLNFPDLGVDGAIVLGGSVTVVAIMNGTDPYLATLLAVFSGVCAGILTGLLHVKGRINELISGIITTTALYSINLIIMGGKPNLSLTNTIFSPFLRILPRNIAFLIASFIIIVLIRFLLNIIFNSKFGIFMRCSGSNPALVRAMGGNLELLKVIGLAISNALVAFCGSIIVQYQGYVDIGMSIGPLILGLTMVMLGLTLQKYLKILQPSLSVMIGAILYQAMIGIALSFGLPTTYLKLSTAVLLVLIFNLNRREKTS